MSYYAQVTDDGHLSFSDQLVRQLGAKPGDIVAADFKGDVVELRVERNASNPLSRLRMAMQGYSVDAFLAERRLDWGE